MDLKTGQEQEDFRQAVRRWLEENLVGNFASLRGHASASDEDDFFEKRLLWEQHMAKAGWTCLGWPRKYGGHEKSLMEQVIFREEYARARAPGLLGHIGEELVGPTLMAFGNEEQKRFFLPDIAASKTVWCQGYSESEAGSDLANVQTKAYLKDGAWIIEGRKIWTSLAHRADWCFVLARSDPNSKGRQGLSYLLVPMKQENIQITPIKQMTGECEFNEILFEAARTKTEHIVGKPGEGWRVAMGTLAFERGISTLGQQMHFRSEFEELVKAARANGAIKDILIRQRLAQAWMELTIMRANGLRMLSAQAGQRATDLPREAYIYKIYWASWHRSLGKLAMDILGARADDLAQAPYGLTWQQRLFLFSRADTIYGGTNQIQRNIIAERALGLPREPRGEEINSNRR